MLQRGDEIPVRQLSAMRSSLAGIVLITDEVLFGCSRINEI